MYMRKRVLVVGFFTEWVTHLGAELELIEGHLRDGDYVVVLSCDGSIGACRLNPEGNRRVCDQCEYRRVRGVQLLSGRVREAWIGDYLEQATLQRITEATGDVVDLESAKAFEWKGRPIGWGAASSAIDLTRDPTGQAEAFKSFTPALLRSAILTYEGVSAFLKSVNPFDIAYVFNGRFECTKGAVCALEDTGNTKVFLHERGCSNARFVVYNDGPTHSRSLAGRRIREHWESASGSEFRKELGCQFFDKRRHGRPDDWVSFVGSQDQQKLPDNFCPKSKSIALFSSSEDEMAAVGDEWGKKIYPRQTEGIERICRDLLRQDPSFHIYVRMHPNLKGVDNADTQLLRSLESENLTLIEPESTVSSYALMQACGKVLTFGSTMGVEATYWGKPSVLAGPALYEDLDCVYVAKDHDHVLELLTADLPARPIDGAIQYGYYWGSFGEPYKFWESDGFFHGTFRGKSIIPYGRFFAATGNRLAKRFGSQNPAVRMLCRLVDFGCWLKGLIRRRPRTNAPD